MADGCPWCGADPVHMACHDTERGVPERDSRARRLRSAARRRC